MQSINKLTLTAMLAEAGITIDGDQPWDLQVHDERLYGRLARGFRAPQMTELYRLQNRKLPSTEPV